MHISRSRNYHARLHKGADQDVQEDMFEKYKLQRLDGHALEALRKMKWCIYDKA
jgi:hypothetical protein